MQKNTYEIQHTESQKTVILLEDKQPILKAKFFHDTADGASLLSDFQPLTVPVKTGLVKITTDLVSEYLLAKREKCKLFCFPGNAQTEFVGSEDYRSAGIERLMLRETKKTISIEQETRSDIAFELLTSIDNLSDNSRIKDLLKQTYWASDADESYIKKAIQNSTFFVARDKENTIVGLVRFVTNNHFAYVSDMVVDQKHRRQGIGTALMAKAVLLIDTQYAFSALISAAEGDGKEAASKLYGEKFGFIDYDKAHTNTVIFRYYKRPEPQKVQTDFFAPDKKKEPQQQSSVTQQSTPLAQV